MSVSCFFCSFLIVTLTRAADLPPALALNDREAWAITIGRMDSTGRTARVLIVEDDEEIAGVLGRTLRLEDYETRIARDGQAALAEARTYMPDVVVLDLGLPDI